MSNKIVLESRIEFEIKDVGNFHLAKLTRKSYNAFNVKFRELEELKKSESINDDEYADRSLDLSYDLLILQGADKEKINDIPIGFINLMTEKLLEVKKSESNPTT